MVAALAAHRALDAAEGVAGDAAPATAAPAAPAAAAITLPSAVNLWLCLLAGLCKLAAHGAHRSCAHSAHRCCAGTSSQFSHTRRAAVAAPVAAKGDAGPGGAADESGDGGPDTGCLLCACSLAALCTAASHEAQWLRPQSAHASVAGSSSQLAHLPPPPEAGGAAALAGTATLLTAVRAGLGGAAMERVWGEPMTRRGELPAPAVAAATIARRSGVNGGLSSTPSSEATDDAGDEARSPCAAASGARTWPCMRAGLWSALSQPRHSR